ncbi:glycosyltransferase [Plastorhodobacter daqingensis]|uniref:Glycosyltransferase n=1 Tax=Plastorhodobacter daqingensis TaxID=1387281 RepID=A0ABW2ULA5_9RHOB
MTQRYDLVFIGLSLSSSWGNGHATTYRALLRGLKAEGKRVLFLERDVPWYAANRDLAVPDFCDLRLYDSVDELVSGHGETLFAARTVVVGSYVPEGRKVIDAVAAIGPTQLCFYDIDTPVTMDLLLRGEEDCLARRQVPLFDIYFSFAGGEVLERLEREFGAQRAVALYCSVDAERHAPAADPTPKWDLGYLGTYSDDRQPKLEALLIEPARRLPDMRFVVAGSQYPDDIDWPANVERIEHLPPDLHAGFYQSQRFTLNVTRADMVAAGWSPSVRLFEAAACHTPIISDFWRGLDELLPEDEAVLIARDAGDVVTILTALSNSHREDIARRAAAIVRQDHTGQARARDLVAALAAPVMERRAAVAGARA